MGRDAVLLSYRLGGTDGVSVEAAKWEGALGRLGFAVRRVAGELDDMSRPDDVLLTWLGRDAATAQPPRPGELASALAGGDLVIVENLCSLPLNVGAARAAAAVLGRRPGRVLFHHHDLPWQRAELSHVTDLPPDRPGSLHVTVNEQSRRDLSARGIDAVTLRNAFDLDARPGDRERTRAAFGFMPDDLVVLQPTRAIPRKDVPAGVRFAERLAPRVPERRVRYWITGPAEDGYGPELSRVLAAAAVSVTEGRASTPADAYAAADVVVLPSTWEGFGNPVVEAIVARKPIAVAPYPVLEELVTLGLELLPLHDPEPTVAWLAAPRGAVLDANLAVARRHLSLADLPSRLEGAFATVGWSQW